MERTDHGLFIVIEGIDGTGKSSQSKLLKSALEKAGHTVVLDREPSDGPYGKTLRATATSGRLLPQEELDLFHQDRRHHLESVILPALNRCETVILDRYYFSTMAYQGQRGFDPEDIRKTNLSFAPNPDILFILDLPVEQALERIGTRGDDTNDFEKHDALQFCRDIFLSVRHEKFAHVIDASLSMEDVHQQMLKVSIEKQKTS